MIKKYLYLVVISLLLANIINAIPTPNSVAFSGSYLLRAYGAEALYWNPASLNKDYRDIVFPGMNQTFCIANNSFDLDNYNYVSGRYLTLKDKKMILSNIDKRLKVDAQAHVFVFGMTLGNLAIATSMHGQGGLRLSKEYIKLALLGNEETDYVFTKKYNQLNFLSYQDYTLGAGDFEISHYLNNDKIPEIKAGFSASALVGIGAAETEYYKGSFHSGMDGMAFKQDIKIKTGIGGLGTKALIGFKSEPMRNLDVGLSFDNLFGFIRWFGKKERLSYSIDADSTYASDLGNDFYTQVDSTEAISDYNTKIPVEMRMGTKYRYKQGSLSMDWVQGFQSSALTSSIGRICLGAEYQPILKMPIKMGFSFGNRDYPWIMSYGLGFYGKYIDCGFGVQTFEYLIPGKHSKGMSFSTNFNLHY